MQNIAFLQNTEELRTELHKLGLSLHAVKINSQSFLMVETSNLNLIKKLAKKHKSDKLYISDSRRALFEVTCCDAFIPTKLGTLTRSLSKERPSGLNTAGTFFLSVYENNQNYYYIAEQNIPLEKNT